MNATREAAELEFAGLTADNYFDYKPNRQNALRGVWSKSALHYAGHSPDNFFAGIDKYATKAMSTGSLVDTLMTEPEKFGSRYFTTEHTDGRSAGYKADKKEAEASGLELVKKAEVEKAEAMISALQGDPLCRVVMGATRTQTPFTSIFKVSGNEGECFMAFKCLPDFIVDHGDGSVSIYDLKTTGLGSDREIVQTSRRFGYHWQELMYRRIIESNDIAIREFSFVFVCTDAPHRTRFVEMNDEVLNGASLGIHRSMSMVYALGTGHTPMDLVSPKLLLGEKPPERDYWNTVDELKVPEVQVDW